MHVFRRLTLGLILCTFLGQAAGASEAQSMTRVLQALSQRDYPLAADLAREVRNPVAGDIVEWYRLRAGGASWRDYVRFLQNNPDWPGLSLMRKRGEAALPAGLSVEQLRGYFGGRPPQTGRGALLYAAALGGEAGQREIIRAWRSLALTRAERVAFETEHKRLIAPHTAARMDNMLWEGRTEQAEAILPALGAADRKLAEARIALQRDTNGVDALIRAVPRERAGDAGLAHDRFAWRMRRDRYEPAEELLRERSTSRESLGRPEEWSNRRRLLSRRAMRENRPREAYNLASQHFLTEGSDYADLEWLSGYLALEYLGDPNRAIRHFERFRLAVETPISLGRAGYWMGRAYEAAGNANSARAAYGFAAAHQTSFYGQLAVERARLPLDTTIAQRGGLPDWRGRPFASSKPVQAAFLFRDAGDMNLMRRFLLHVEEGLDARDSAALAKMALDARRAFVAVRIAKREVRQGIVLPDAYYPVTGLARASGPVVPELALAIARQESELNSFAISPAGARGLMQLMPATARKVSSDLGLPYQLAKLTEDPEYNAKLGTTYLGQMMERYNGSVLLAAVAYNAGPHRADSWIARYGDPRSPRVDPIWWIENIPFRETRNYTMRVLESLHVYRMRINGPQRAIGLKAELGIR